MNGQNQCVAFLPGTKEDHNNSTSQFTSVSVGHNRLGNVLQDIIFNDKFLKFMSALLSFN